GGTRFALPRRLQARLWRIKDSTMRYSQGKLPLLPGAWYVITDNSAFAPELGIAKGSQMRLDQILLDPEEPQHDSTAAIVYLHKLPTLIMHFPESRLIRPLTGMKDIYTLPITSKSVTADVPMSTLFGQRVSRKTANELDNSNPQLAASFQYAKTLCNKCKKRRKPKRARLCVECKAESEGRSGTCLEYPTRSVSAAPGKLAHGSYCARPHVSQRMRCDVKQSIGACKLRLRASKPRDQARGLAHPHRIRRAIPAPKALHGTGQRGTAASSVGYQNS